MSMASGFYGCVFYKSAALYGRLREGVSYL